MLSLGKDYASFPLGVSRFPIELNSRYNPYIVKFDIITYKTTALFAQSGYLKHNLSSDIQGVNNYNNKNGRSIFLVSRRAKSVEVSCSSLAVRYSFNNQSSLINNHFFLYSRPVAQVFALRHPPCQRHRIFDKGVRYTVAFGVDKFIRHRLCFFRNVFQLCAE